MTESETDQLIALGHSLGGHPARLTIWREGSCAAKLPGGDFLVSKRGMRLDQLGPESFAKLDAGSVAELSKSEAAGHERARELLGEASEDALIYAYLLSLDGVGFCAHTQPIEVNQIICSPRARQFADRRTAPGEIAACGAASLLVPYADPGLALAREVRRKMHLWNDRHKVPPRVVLLQNHGMINLGATPDALLHTAEMTIKSAQIFIGAALMGGPSFLTPGNVSQIEALRGT